MDTVLDGRSNLLPVLLLLLMPRVPSSYAWLLHARCIPVTRLLHALYRLYCKVLGVGTIGMIFLLNVLQVGSAYGQTWWLSEWAAKSLGNKSVWFCA